ncbi:MAG: single-stranded-DNA-specific exonuclease RecJ [Bacteroidetes bacterium]|nr:single-stranded-DNA-specific exonuclease RecJ [Bacteroidota bacterium]NBX64268.1 single-stranded-DNA-specific exonuclease RecJ [Bacteroidota bacterium]
MEYRWRAKPLPNQEQVLQLSESIRVNPYISTILVQRGIDTYEKAEKFFRPKLEDLHNPFEMKDMDVAIKRIQTAVTNQEGILVYGDYDVDGTTAVSIVYSYFKSFNQNIEYYIPDRYKEGYGISRAGLEYAAEKGFTLVITLDCGIRSNDLVDYGNSLGLEMIICDHHLPGDTLPKAAAILNPKRRDCTYPYKELSGAGIGFKLIQAYNEKQGMPTEMVYDYLDMVAVSIASDLVDIRGENRVLSFYGLKKLNENPSIGLQTLLDDCPKKEQYTISDIIFGIGPRINAAGRIADAKAAVKVLIEKDYNTAKKYAKVLSERNHERKELDSDITRDAVDMVQKSPRLMSKYSMVLQGEGWSKGVIGIVASRMVEQFYKPTIVFSLNDGMLTGSARSIKTFDIHEAIGACGELVEQFGGHKYAAGLSIKVENFDAFADKFEAIVRESVTADDLVPVVEYDLEMETSMITPGMMKILKQLSPFGPGNSIPVFRSNNLRANQTAKILKDRHLKMQVQTPNGPMDSIGFGLAEHWPSVTDAQIFHACYCIEENTYNGRTNLQLRLQDIKTN